MIKKRQGQITFVFLSFHCSAESTAQKAADKRPRLSFADAEGCRESLGRKAERTTVGQKAEQGDKQVLSSFSMFPFI